MSPKTDPVIPARVDPSRPDLLARIRANFPQELIGRPDKPQSERWCLWKYVTRGEKTTKLPHQPSGSPAESNNPRTWSTFDAVCEVYRKGSFDGIGCFIADPFIAVDFDHVRNKDTGEIEPWALAAIQQLNSYTEVSPSGTGLHVWSYGKVSGSGKKRGRVEIYAEKRYFTVSGERVREFPATVNEIPDGFYQKIETLDPLYKPSTAATITNERITKAQKIHHLTQGDWKSAGFPSQSEGDCAWCVHLAEIFNGDIEKIDAAFRKSPLMREKWDKVHNGVDTYGQMTIAKALAKFKTKTSKLRRLKITSLEEVAPDVLVWLWKNKVPLGKVTLFSGPPGIGKTTVTDDLISRLSRGELGEPGLTFMLAQEEDLSDTVVPRLMAMKANLSTVKCAEQTIVTEGDMEYPESVALDSDLGSIVDWLKDNPAARLIVVDPITNYLGKANMNREQEVRSVLMPLVEIAKEYHVAIILIGHFNKTKDGDAITRQGGATALTGVPRVVWNFTKSSENEGECLMSSPKNAHLKSLRYKIVNKEVKLSDGKTTEVGVIEWLGETDVTAEEVLTELNAPDKKDRGAAKRWLVAQLADGKERDATELVRAGSSALGCGENTIRRAAQNLPVVKRPHPNHKQKEFWKITPKDGEQGEIF